MGASDSYSLVRTPVTYRRLGMLTAVVVGFPSWGYTIWDERVNRVVASGKSNGWTMDDACREADSALVERGSPASA